MVLCPRVSVDKHAEIGELQASIQEFTCAMKAAGRDRGEISKW